MWHERLGHPGPEAIAHLHTHASGATLIGPATVECEVCAKSKLTAQISRVPRHEDEHDPPEEIGDHWAIDFLQLDPDQQEYWNEMVFTERISGYSFEMALKGKKTDYYKDSITYFINILRNVLKVFPKVFECDNEIENNDDLRRLISITNGIKIEASAPNNQAQNGGAERANGVLKQRAAALHISSRLPKDLWREFYRAGIYLGNRTPRQRLKWKTPYEVFFSWLAQRANRPNAVRVPYLGHLKAYGCKAYALTKAVQLNQQRTYKHKARAWVGFLVGYNSTNIYRIWNPVTGQTLAMRDVIFNEDERYSGNPEDLKDDVLKLTTTELQTLLEELREPEAANRQQYATAPHLEDEEISEDETETDREEVYREEEPEEVAEIGSKKGSRSAGGEIDYLSSKQRQPTLVQALPTLERTPPRDSPPQALFATTLIISDRE